MRPFILLSTLIVLAACNDDQHATAPISRSLNRATSPAGDTRVSSQLPSAQGKPTTVVGFTTITPVLSTLTFNPGVSGTVHADCPAGTTVVSGGFGYDLQNGFPTVAAPSMISAGIVGNNWSIVISNNLPGAITWTIDVVAYCAS
jgi:hypothetical protein